MDTIGKLYVLAGVANIGGLLMFNRFYTTAGALEALVPTLFSIEGQMLINLWGLAYIGTAKNWRRLPLLNITFCVEKLAFVFWWIQAMQNEAVRSTALAMVTSGEDVLTGLFVLGFGPNDFLFGLVFGYCAWSSLGQQVAAVQSGGTEGKKFK